MNVRMIFNFGSLIHATFIGEIDVQEDHKKESFSMHECLGYGAMVETFCLVRVGNMIPTLAQLIENSSFQAYVCNE